ncbi:MAG: SDR family oxidoreductase [Anaerolineales bacterium]|nr:SDR family oxidoreductase [Anaerolineales bacterium]
MPDPTRLFITGGSSYLGQHLVPLAQKAGLPVAYSYFSHNPWPVPAPQTTAVSLDLRHPTAVSQAIAAHQPQIIIHLAGSNRADDMSAVIIEGTRAITQAAQTHQARLIHLSTDVIFDGRQAPYDETAVPSPLHEYGRAKAEAEAIVQTHPNHIIIRTSLIYGLRQIDRGTEWMLAALRQNQPITLFDNQWRNPVWVMTLAQACLELATTQTDLRGILNIAGQQAVTRAELGLKLLDWWQLSPEKRSLLTVAPAPADAPWPPDTRLVLDRAQRHLHTPLLGLDEVLAQAPNAA